ncbi:hypothetical protein V6B33_05250 [Mangrovibacillus sp. Mu-81]|jgi:hypothetical protein|uniref:hypothetical protein n=1 Tax=Mangrovibacillus sp. Mu-81 TaxID=3121478 RepID=UPI002FE4EE27
MKMRKMFSNMKLKWHSLRVLYNQALLEGCLDCQLKKKLKQKIEYHEMKMIHLLKGQAHF